MVEEAPQPSSSVATHKATPHQLSRADSGSSSSLASNRSVRTLTSDDVQYFHENGRTYANRTYYLPCVYPPKEDFREQDRLSLQHQVFVHALQGNLTTAKILPSTRRILDLGTGPGHWSVAMSHQYPNVEVFGIDLTEWDLDTTEATLGESKVQWQLDDLDVWGRTPDLSEMISKLAEYDFFAEPSNRDPLESPTRTKFKAGLDELSQQAETSVESLNELVAQPEAGWHFSEPFELIHLRNMKGVFAHWEEVFAEIYKSLSPGGSVEIADFDLGQMPILPEAEDQSNQPLTTVRKLYAALLEASFKSGRPLGTFYMHSSYLEEAGFQDIQTTSTNVPVGPWHKDEKQKSIGKLMLVLMVESFEVSMLRLLTKWGDREKRWAVEEIEQQVATARQEIVDWSARAERGEVEGWCACFKWITGKKSWHDR